MNLGDDRNSHMNLTDKKMNLGGLSESVCAKYQAGYTPESGVIKPSQLVHMELLENSRAKSFIKTPKLNVILCVFANDGTALETGHWVRFSVKGKHRSKNSSRYSTRLNPSPSPKYLKDNIVTEVIVASLTPLGNFCSLRVAVDYTTHRGKTASQAMADLFREHIETLQSCESYYLLPWNELHKLLWSIL